MYSEQIKLQKCHLEQLYIEQNVILILARRCNAIGAMLKRGNVAALVGKAKEMHNIKTWVEPSKHWRGTKRKKSAEI